MLSTWTTTLRWRINPGSHIRAVGESYQPKMTSVHCADRNTFRWFIYVVRGEYEAVRIPTTILGSWDEHGRFIIVGTALIICQLECNELAFCERV